MRYETPIVVDTTQSRQMPIKKVPAFILEAVASSNDTQVRAAGRAFVRLLECFLQITGLSFGAKPTSPIVFERVIKPFIGAIYSDNFYSATLSNKYKFIAILKNVYGEEHIYPTINHSQISADVIQLINQFENIALRPWECYLWRGWPITNRLGRIKWLKIYPVAIKFGVSFADKLHKVIATYFATIRSGRIPVLDKFLEFLATYKDVSSENLLMPGFMQKFWTDFWIYYATNCPTTKSNNTLLTEWTCSWVYFVKQQLIPGKIVAPLLQESLPGPNKTPTLQIRGSDNGSIAEISQLLVTLPKSATDSKAWELLLERIPKSITQIETWATYYANDLWARTNRRALLSKSGTATLIGTATGTNTGRDWNVSRLNPQHLANAASTYELFGHNEKSLNRYPKPIAQTAYELGLPTTYALIPHATLISLCDAKITPAFLESLVMYNDSGMLVGLSEQGNAKYLIGFKFRRGPKHAQQIIKIDENTWMRVMEVIEITKPLRTYLREKGDSSWKNLLLTCGRGFNRPSQQRLNNTTNSFKLSGVLEKQIVEACDVTISEAQRLARNFSLSNVRNTLGVKRFAETHSEEEAAKALGHAAYYERLLERYVPPPILAFWRERWIRSFQNNILIYADIPTKHKIRAVGVSSFRELEEFMNMDGYKSLKNIFDKSEKNLERKAGSLKTNQESSENSKFIFNANINNLLALLAIKDGHIGNLSKAECKFWLEFAIHIYKNLEERKKLDPVLYRLMISAQERYHAIK